MIVLGEAFGVAAGWRGRGDTIGLAAGASRPTARRCWAYGAVDHIR